MKRLAAGWMAGVALLSVMAAAYLLQDRTPPVSVSAPAHGSLAVRDPLPDEGWLGRMAAAPHGSAENERMLGSLRTDLPLRPVRLATLVEAIRQADPPLRGVLCDMLAAEHPAEVAAELRAMVRDERDADTAARLLDALCAATMPSRDGPGEDRVLAAAFEQAQAAIDEELVRRGDPPERRRAALQAIVEVFPLAEARARLAAAAESAGPGEQLLCAELGWELLAGSATDATELLAHLDAHPEVLASEERKAATLEQIDVSALSSAPGEALRPLLWKLRPAPAADAAFSRWFELLAIRGHERDDRLFALLETADPLDLASILHFGGPGWPEDLEARLHPGWQAKLRLAAEQTADPEQRDFLIDAAGIAMGGAR